MPPWLRISLIGLLVLVVLLTGIPMLMGGSAMAPESCPSGGIMAVPVCVTVPVAAIGITFLAGIALVVGPRRDRFIPLLLAASLDRPPQFG